MTVIDPRSLVGSHALDRSGATIGTIHDVFTDPHGQRSGWLAIATGLGGNHIGLVPLHLLRPGSGAARIEIDKHLVHSAPHHDPDMALSTEEEAALFEHYGIDPGERAAIAITTPLGEVPTLYDATTEDAERTTPRLHEGAPRIDVARHTNERDVADTGQTIYPDDEVEATLEADNARRQEAARTRHADGL